MIHDIGGKYRGALSNPTKALNLPPVCIRLSEDESAIEGLFSYFIDPGPELTDVRLHLAILARHRSCAARGVGEEALAQFEALAMEVATGYSDHGRLFLTAEVHEMNAPAVRALSAHEWAHEGQMNDPAYGKWIKTISFAAPVPLG
ncbi:hypothetical protein [Arthrobacter sp. G119Y2]|uniref:hypothetical protein n=1 Tax=Arthrobacter sp. G119Y2 TaxID=3134965 RepID=UPI00311A3283